MDVDAGLEVYLRNPEATLTLGRALGKRARPGDVILLTGELGAGKTTLAQGLAQGLGVKSRVTSPSFTLIQEYQGHYPLYHVDLYRLDNAEAIWELGLEEYLGGGGITVIEWGERIMPSLRELLHIFLETVSSGGRRARLVPHGRRYEQLLTELSGEISLLV
ncbi:MAG: tRNA (adenosine(37)-N6)-threonylcarbamoyltransferase complex ATPase subunit type 1 TsaE [Moorellaceae bacterium]